jgi:hypothetical protein
MTVRLEKAGAEVQAVGNENQRNTKTDTAEHGDRFENVEIGRDRRNDIRERFCNCSHGNLLSRRSHPRYGKLDP